MKQAFIYLTLRCNNHCPMCYMRNHYSKIEEIDFEDARLLLQSLMQEGVEKVTFLGGEPTMYTRLNDLLWVVKELQIPFVRLQTNGQFDESLLSSSAIVNCVDAITFSLDGHTAELNEKMRKGADYEMSIRNITRSLTLGKKIAVNTTISGVNIDYTCSIINHIRNMGVQHLYLNLFFDAGKGGTDQDTMGVLPQKWKKTYDDIIDNYSNSHMRIKLPVGFSDDRHVSNSCLGKNLERIYVMPNLDMYSCILFINNPQFKLQHYALRKSEVHNAYGNKQCHEHCIYLKDEYLWGRPMCLYNKRNVGISK